jgi:hypothetical protein
MEQVVSYDNNSAGELRAECGVLVCFGGGTPPLMTIDIRDSPLIRDASQTSKLDKTSLASTGINIHRYLTPVDLGQY